MPLCSQCPHCLKNAPGSTITTFVKLDRGYVDEPVMFVSDGIPHSHDPNPYIATWRCQNGHEFQIENLKPCLGCPLDRRLVDEKRRNEEIIANRLQSTGPLIEYV